MRLHRWSEVIRAVEPDDEFTREAIARFAYFEDNPNPEYVPPMPWIEGNQRYADAHEFDRAAVSTFVSPHDRNLPARFALTLRKFRQRSFIDSRATLIGEWEGYGDPVTALPEIGYTEEMLLSNRLCTRAGTYLHYRGYPTEVLAALAEPLRALCGEITHVDRHQARLDGRDVPEGDDDLDRVLDATLAGMSAEEIRGCLTGGTWPSGIRLVTALRS